MPTLTAEDYIQKLDLQVHPEGGYFKEVYRAVGEIAEDHLPKNCQGSRSYATSIYFLLKADQFSAFHKINQDEGWHFYAGCSLTIHMISPQGDYSTAVVGNKLLAGEQYQFYVPAGYYFAATVNSEQLDQFALVGCTVAPGFDFADFVMPSQAELMVQFPQYKDIIQKLGFQA